MNLSMPIMVIIHPKAILFKIIKQHGLITINSKLLYQKINQFCWVFVIGCIFGKINFVQDVRYDASGIA
jgi:hypothetical protein